MYKSFNLSRLVSDVAASSKEMLLFFSYILIKVLHDPVHFVENLATQFYVSNSV